MEPDVLPESLNSLMALLWMSLFGGRWLLMPLFQAARLINPDQVAALDDGLLKKTYLILLSITCVVLALRAVRTAQRPRLPDQLPLTTRTPDGAIQQRETNP